MLGGISQELTSAGYSVLLTTRQGAADAAVQAADGLILLGQGVRQDAVRLYDKLGMPMVVWGAASQGGDNHIVVGSDNRQGRHQRAERFLSIGRRNPVNPDHPEMAQRLFGFVDELAGQGIKPLLLRRVDFTLESGVDAVRSLHSRKVRFDAIFACSDLLAMGAIACPGRTRAIGAQRCIGDRLRRHAAGCELSAAIEYGCGRTGRKGGRAAGAQSTSADPRSAGDVADDGDPRWWCDRPSAIDLGFIPPVRCELAASTPIERQLPPPATRTYSSAA